MPIASFAAMQKSSGFFAVSKPSNFTHVPVEEPSTESGAGVRGYAGLLSCPNFSWRSLT